VLSSLEVGDLERVPGVSDEGALPHHHLVERLVGAVKSVWVNAIYGKAQLRGQILHLAFIATGKRHVVGKEAPQFGETANHGVSRV